MWWNRPNPYHQKIFRLRRYVFVNISFQGDSYRNVNLRKAKIQMLCILQNLFDDHAYSIPKPNSPLLTKRWFLLKRTSHPSQKHSRSTHSSTTISIHEQQNNSPCPFWPTMRPGLDQHRAKPSCKHATRYISSQTPLHPRHLSIRTKSRTLALPSCSYSSSFKCREVTKPAHAFVIVLINDKNTNNKAEETPTLVHVACKALLQPHKECRVMATTPVLSIHILRRWILEGTFTDVFW